jgi:hypothetical protein
MLRKRVSRAPSTSVSSPKRVRFTAGAEDDSRANEVEHEEAEDEQIEEANEGSSDSVSPEEEVQDNENDGDSVSSEEEEDDDEEMKMLLEKYPGADKATRKAIKQLWSLLPGDYVVDPVDFNRAAPAAMSSYFQLGVDVYELADSPHFQCLADRPDLLLRHVELDVPGRGFFPVKVPTPAVAGAPDSSFDPATVPLGKLRIFDYGTSSAQMIESLYQLQVTGAAVIEYRNLLRPCGLVPGYTAPRYRIDTLATDPHRAEAGWLRHQLQLLIGGSNDLLTAFTDNDEGISKISAAISALKQALDTHAPFLRQGIEGALQTSGELFESSGKSSSFFLSE